MKTATMTYPFTEEQMEHAAAEWGCNCGPSALAFALQISLESVRHAIPGFDEKRYTSPTMMRATLRQLRRPVAEVSPVEQQMFDRRPALVRIQWTGPWTAPGANPKWAYRQTHWIATWRDAVSSFVFDCNGGVMTPDRWRSEIVPFITSYVPRADGGWFPTHIWRIA